ncbi:MAG: hypothetical protein FWG87_14205 [Defluviitaleaceae bacterium]|nr:hypothetical protein [Defluviitaleaceae bacterium]
MNSLCVGDGLVRPEITSPCFNGRCLPRIDERAYLGTDKSVPYKNRAKNPTNSVLKCD